MFREIKEDIIFILKERVNLDGCRCWEFKVYIYYIFYVYIKCVNF